MSRKRGDRTRDVFGDSDTGKVEAPRVPSTMQMVSEAIRSVQSTKGASLQAIRAHILTKYPEVGPARIQGPLKRCLRNSLGSGTLVRPAGSGLGNSTINGRFKLAKPTPPDKKSRQPRVAKRQQTTEAKKENASLKRVKTKAVASTKDADHKMAAKGKAVPVVKLKRVTKQQKVASAKVEPNGQAAKKTVRRTPKKVPRVSSNFVSRRVKPASKKAAVKGQPS
uniref:H15 domain-containing protein n=1 Tax=Eptatretus burgeri TaxID=7764 RepID=A0A8C4R5T4_EPTBU